MSKVNNILILGNGFDLNLGLNSRFSDYISDVFAKENIKLSEIAKYLNIHNKEQRLHELYGFLDSKGIDLSEFIQNNWLIFLCFYEMQNLNKLNWADVEQNLTKYICSTDFQNDIPIQLLANYYCRDDMENEKVEPWKIIQHIDNFTRQFAEYLKIIIDKDKTESKENKTLNFKTKAWEKIKCILNSVSPENNWRNNLKVNSYILNFNYTNWFESFVDELGCQITNFKVNNIHGSIDQVSKCIIGIDDKKVNLSMNSVDLYSKGLTNSYAFSKTYKRLCNCNYDLDLPLPYNNEIQTNIIFCGLSLSENDQIYYESIFNKYDIYNNKQVYIYFFQFRGYELFPKIYHLFKKYGESFDNKLQGNTLITQLSIEGRLKIIEFS